MSRRRVVITGLGTVNPIAHDVPAFWKGLLAGKSGIGPITLIDSTAFKVHNAGEVRDFHPEAVINSKEVRRMDRFAQFGMFAALEAVRDSGLDFAKEDPYRCGAIIGSGIGGLTELEEQFAVYLEKGPGRIGPFVVPKMIANAASGHVSIHFGLMGPNAAVATACASAAHAAGDALRAIQHDQADVMITGGAEAAITHMGVGGFVSARALSLRVNDDPNGASRPFDKDRDGFVLSEGAGIVVLEEFEHARRRGAKVYAELLGVGSTADAYHITAPHPEGAGASRAMQNALRDSGLAPTDIDYVNAHGTSTDLGDTAETTALKRVFGEHAYKLAVSSTKSMLGHTLGASGGIELIATALTIQHRVVHPTINYQTPDPTCDLDYVPNRPREMRVRHAISNSFGFGGHNCTLVVGALR
jgi:3-oxoacyl-[acyl-carrier-protein] synthase II